MPMNSANDSKNFKSITQERDINVYLSRDSKILIKFILNKPVIGSICLRMKYEEAVISPIGAIARPIGVNPVTNTIIYDPEQFKVLDISTQVLEFMLAHEALHLLTGSLIRRGDRDPYLWNIACDYEVNYLLHDIGFKVPKMLSTLPTFIINTIMPKNL